MQTESDTMDSDSGDATVGGFGEWGDFGGLPQSERTGVSAVHVMPQTEAAGITDAGRLRAKNEDAFSVFLDLGLFVVADGLGGQPAGEVASCLAVEHVEKALRAANRRPSYCATSDDHDLLAGARLSGAVQAANEALAAAARENVSLAGMATTLTALHLTRTHAYFAHVGDSRVYRLRDQKLTLLTEDHSVAVEYQKLRGKQVDAQVLAVQRAHLTRCLGTKPVVRVSVGVERLVQGDVYLLCTDGLWGVVPDALTKNILTSFADPHDVLRRLVDTANELGGPDNITAVVVRPAALGT